MNARGARVMQDFCLWRSQRDRYVNAVDALMAPGCHPARRTVAERAGADAGHAVMSAMPEKEGQIRLLLISWLDVLVKSAQK